MKTPPKTIRIRFTEADRQKAGPYVSNRCLVETALNRMGYEGAVEWISGTRLNGRYYDHRYFGSKEAHAIECANRAPFYGPEVVGKTLTLRRV